MAQLFKPVNGKANGKDFAGKVKKYQVDKNKAKWLLDRELCGELVKKKDP